MNWEKKLNLFNFSLCMNWEGYLYSEIRMSLSVFLYVWIERKNTKYTSTKFFSLCMNRKKNTKSISFFFMYELKERKKSLAQNIFLPVWIEKTTKSISFFFVYELRKKYCLYHKTLFFLYELREKTTKSMSFFFMYELRERKTTKYISAKHFSFCTNRKIY